MTAELAEFGRGGFAIGRKGSRIVSLVPLFLGDRVDGSGRKSALLDRLVQC